MAFSIVGIKKHTTGSLGSADGHNRRIGDFAKAKNIDPNGKKQRMMLHDNKLKKTNANISLSDVVKAKLKQLDIKSHRKDAVVAVELMLSASPEYFRPEDPTQHGEYDSKRLSAWLKGVESFLASKYKGLVVDVALHLDEATPHVHVMVVPALKKERKRKQKKADKEAGKPPETYVSYGLCAKDMFNKEALIDLHTDYNANLKHLGLERGIPGSDATHEQIKDFYRKASSPNKYVKRLEARAKSLASTVGALKRSVNDFKQKLGESLGFFDKVSHDGSEEPESIQNHSESDQNLDYTP